MSREWRQTHCLFFFFNDTATTEIYTLSLHDALPILVGEWSLRVEAQEPGQELPNERRIERRVGQGRQQTPQRSEEHTSELQSRRDLVCRLLLEKKKKK